MALRWLEGYEVSQSATYLARKYASSSGGASAAGRLGGTAKAMSSAGQGDRTASLSSQSKWFMGFGYKANAATATVDSTYRWFTGASEQVRLRIQGTATGTLTVTVIRGSTVLATYSGSAFTTNAWHYVEFYVKVHTTTGEIQVRLDEVDIISLTTGLNTANNGTNDADVMGWAKDAGGTQEHIDDIYICDDTSAINNSFRGDSQIEGILPTTDGAITQWTTSTGTNHAALVDDAANSPNDTDYNSDGTVGNEDLYNYGNLAVTTGTIYGVMVVSDARLDVAGTRGFKANFRESGGTRYQGAEHTVNSTSVSEFTHIWEQNPDTATDWTNSDIDNGQFGVYLST